MYPCSSFCIHNNRHFYETGRNHRSHKGRAYFNVAAKNSLKGWPSQYSTFQVYLRNQWTLVSPGLASHDIYLFCGFNESGAKKIATFSVPHRSSLNNIWKFLHSLCLPLLEDFDIKQIFGKRLTCTQNFKQNYWYHSTSQKAACNYFDVIVSASPTFPRCQFLSNLEL